MPGLGWQTIDTPFLNNIDSIRRLSEESQEAFKPISWDIRRERFQMPVNEAPRMPNNEVLNPVVEKDLPQPENSLIATARSLLRPGLRYSQVNRNKEGFFDCTSFMTRTLQKHGYNVPDMYSGNMMQYLTKAGFEAIPYSDNDLREGDILFRQPDKYGRNGHAAFYGNKTLIGAHNSKTGVGEIPYYGNKGWGFTHIIRRRDGKLVPAPTPVNTNPSDFRRSYTYSDTHRVTGLPVDVEQMINEEQAKIGGLPVTLIKAIAKRESGGRQNLVSKAGARGIMQIIPKYASEFGGTPEGVINDPRMNIRVGINEINKYYKQFNDVGLALLAYNWGPGNVASYLKTGKGYYGQPMPKEAREYVDLVLKNIEGM